MEPKLNKYILLLFLFRISFFTIAQDEGVKKPVYKDYKSDTTYARFNKLKNKVAYAQINLLKTGALLVRLKTNKKAINKFKAVGNIDMATQMQQETDLENKIIMSAYRKEFNFCPVYFFYSECSDSVRHNAISGIFVDTLLNVNPNIVCNATFFLIAEQDDLRNSSLGLIPESLAKSSVEGGSYERNAGIVIKNKYFFQLHKPFPYFQIKAGDLFNSIITPAGFYLDIQDVLMLYRRVSSSASNYRRVKGFRGVVAAFNSNLEAFYKAHIGATVTPDIKELVY
jgi:hypothetical protein